MIVSFRLALPAVAASLSVGASAQQGPTPYGQAISIERAKKAMATAGQNALK